LLKFRLNRNSSEKESFLIEACRAAHGDTKKRIEVSQIYQKLNLSGERAEPLSKTINSLVAQGHIIEIANQQQVTITRTGFYFAIKISGLSASNFGMVSYEEAKVLSFELLKHFCIKSTKNVNDEINIDKITIGDHLDAYGGATLNQLIDILTEEGLVKYIDDNGKIEVTPKGIKEVVKRLLFY
jgi:hypothetical protein